MSSSTTRVAVLGASGRMGRLVVAEVLAAGDLSLVAAVGHTSHLGADVGTLSGRSPSGVKLEAIGPSCFRDAQVIVDFSLPEALTAALPHVQVPLVSGTTGLTPAAEKGLEALSSRVGVLHATNFSTGVNLLLHLVREAARALPEYDVEIVETHHRLKQDSPSGTALSLGAAVAEGRAQDLARVSRHGREGRVGVRPGGEIGFHAVRGGDVVGDHDVWLLGPGERVRFGHIASSRQTFAAGAVRAARWLAARGPGRFTMNHVLGLGVVFLLAVLASGCHNACQDICYDMKRYAEDECGLVVADGDLKACVDAQAGSASRDQRGVCRQYNSQAAIDEEWGCDELADYFESAP